MENKYFTPDIEDIHVGYECEVLKDKWEHFVFNIEEIIPVFAKINSKTIFSEKIRVPYLTKEQIEAERWKIKNNYPEFPTFEKENYWLTLITDENKPPFIRIMGIDPMLMLHVKHLNGYAVYQGECKSINEFRKIIKLLGV